MTVFGDVNVSVYGNSDILNSTFSLKCVLLENQKCNHFKRLLYIDPFFYLLFIPVSFIKFNPLSLSLHFNTKILERSCFKWRTAMSRDLIFQGISNSQLI